MANNTLTFKEILDMRNTISDIDSFLAQIGLTEEKIRDCIYYLNKKYPDNIAVYRMGQRKRVSHRHLSDSTR